MTVHETMNAPYLSALMEEAAGSAPVAAALLRCPSLQALREHLRQLAEETYQATPELCLFRGGPFEGRIVVVPSGRLEVLVPVETRPADYFLGDPPELDAACYRRIGDHAFLYVGRE